MPKKTASLIIIFLMFLSPFSWGWDTFGHLLISDLARSNLSPAKQREFDQLAFSLVKQMDAQKRLYLMRTYSGTSALAQLSVFPDDWRDKTVASLYADYAESIPSALAPFADSTTSSWHSINQPYRPDGQISQCNTIADENVLSMLPVLLQAYSESNSTPNKALTLALIVHFIGDAHNPMHTMAKVEDGCETDMGGNGICAVYRRGSASCEQTLRQAWDSALGFFDDYETIAAAMEYVSYVEVDPEAAEIIEPSVWVAEGYDLARLVYSLKAGDGLDPYYIEEGKIISYQRVALAAERLALILDSL